MERRFPVVWLLNTFVHNPGPFAVVEGVGDHGYEYMTRGRVIILGDTGRWHVGCIAHWA